ncbi:T9SS type A sorting domain-containing protein [Mariniflexile maritimum]|uniref:T9SS type A sorting domain-containing protein n=1 Tax=Mariniflexile maritimum TaxID=2682493 RepID=UPI0012F700FC|nr:T9SS type A sorting domain-containing protein [Mariniflexile maritimum]
MKLAIIVFVFLMLPIAHAAAQVVLNADGPGNTYERINAVLAPGFDAVEASDCSHTSFGKHIDEIFDTELNTYVFRFQIHVSPDNDRCINFDRQRNEIKTYEKSPDNLKGIEGETVVYKWTFKLDAGFQSSSSFTHIHQLKSVGGLYEAMPMYTLTTRKGTPDKLELRYAETNTQVTLKQTDLTPFKGTWVEATETIKYGNNTSAVSGTYSISIKRVSDGTELFSYTNNAIKNWQTNADFVRPKWGIYRSLNDASNLRDETVLFAHFSIEEMATLSASPFEKHYKSSIKIIPNPANHTKLIKVEALPNSFESIAVYDNLGRLHKVLKPQPKTLDISGFKSGLYFLIFKKYNRIIATETLLVP